ncbi:MAG: hypothetical protein ABI895_29170 [Deltaproteobacteria bacterium]
MVEEVFAELDRELWTSLSGIDGEPFKTFEAFCLDPKGLGCDPGPVKALIVKLRGHNATKLLTVPQRRQGQRNDLEATSRPKGEKLRKTPGNHTRCRSILGGPPNVERAFRSRQLSEKDSASLSSYALRNPDCPKLKAILLDLGNVPATASPRAVLKDLRGRIRELSAAGGRSKKALAPEQRPPSSSTSTPDISTVTASLGSGGAENQAVQVSLARDHERVGDADDVRADSGTNGLTTTREVALLRFLGGWLDLKRLGLGGVDPAALREILWEVSAAGNLPEIRRTLREFELLCEVAELVKVLDPAFPNYADLCKIATREASPVPATIDGARDEVARRLKFPGAVKKAHPSRETKTANVT